MSSGWLVPPRVAAVASSSARLPSCPTEKLLIVPLPPFAVYAKRLFFETTSQQGAPSPVATALLITVAPAAATSYEDAVPPASEESRWPLLSKSKPNGVEPPEGETAGPAASPSWSTVYTEIRFVPFSVTASRRPS